MLSSGSGAAHTRRLSAPQKIRGFCPLQRIIASLGANVDSRPALGGGDDIRKLQKAGVPVVSLRQDGLDYFDTHHTADDTLDKIDPKQRIMRSQYGRPSLTLWPPPMWILGASRQRQNSSNSQTSRRAACRAIGAKPWGEGDDPTDSISRSG